MSLNSMTHSGRRVIQAVHANVKQVGEDFKRHASYGAADCYRLGIPIIAQQLHTTNSHARGRGGLN